MPLIKSGSHRVNTLRQICPLREPNRDTLVAYARFIGESVGYVLNQRIATTFAKDRDFIGRGCPDPESTLTPSTERPTREAACATAPEDWPDRSHHACVGSPSTGS